MMDQLWRDLRYALRQLTRSPGFTAIAVLTLGLGIGANTAIFSVVNAALLRPLPYEDPSSLVKVNETRPDGSLNSVSYPNFIDWRKQNGAFRSIALFRDLAFNLAGRAEPERIAGALVSADFFRTLGLSPVLGRYFAEGRDHRLLLSLDPGLQGYDSARSQLLYRGLLDRVREIPEVSAASLSFPLPLDTYGRNRSVFIEGDASATDGGTLVIGTSVTAPGYFGAVGTTLLQGRDFAAADSATAVKVAVVNQTMAALLGGGRDVIGREFRLEGPEGERVRVIGVARDGKYGTIGESPQPYIYLPLSQHPSTWLTLVVRTRGDPTALIPAVREVVHRLDPDLAPFGVMTMDRHLENALNVATSSAVFAGGFGLIALLLAVVGIYGLVSYAVARRTREVGIRIALGADAKDVLRLVLGKGLSLAALGVSLGLAGALATARLVGGMLYDVSPWDPWIFVSMSLLLAGVVLLASYFPARRALRVDPVTSLRSE
jgi:predicted permease